MQEQIEDKGYSVLLPEQQFWRESNIMKIPNTNLLEGLGGMERMGGRLWRMPPYSANTWHKHIDSWEFYFVLEGTGRMRVGEDTIEVPRYGSVLVAPNMLRQVFNDTESETLWLVIASPQEGQSGRKPTREDFYPEDPRLLPSHLAGHRWPPSSSTSGTSDGSRPKAAQISGNRMRGNDAMLRLYDYWESGNCYKVRLLLAQLGTPFERVHLDILKGETRMPAFLAKYRNGRVPLLEWPDGRRLAESNAILWHLAEGSPFLPDDAWHRAQVLQWMFFEQYSHEPHIAVVRFWHFAGLVEQNRSSLAEKVERGYRALGVMEEHLKSKTYFVSERYTIADIALYAYTHVADEGDFDLSEFPAIREWLTRVGSQPGHVKITDEVGDLVPSS